jgi:diaminohydroxyphosphoribosylaminopyrimidine deaminase/5-amino-6-(5-phosphoribosylamino)uracil reductase
VLDTTASLSPSSRLAQSARRVPVWLVCARPGNTEGLRSLGVEIIQVAADADGRIDAAAAASELGKRQLSRVLIEGGGEVASAFLKASLVDRISLYRAGKILGGDSRTAVGALGVQKVDFAPRFALVSRRVVGADTLETWHRGA